MVRLFACSVLLLIFSAPGQFNPWLDSVEIRTVPTGLETDSGDPGEFEQEADYLSEDTTGLLIAGTGSTALSRPYNFIAGKLAAGPNGIRGPPIVLPD